MSADDVLYDVPRSDTLSYTYPTLQGDPSPAYLEPINQQYSNER